MLKESAHMVGKGGGGCAGNNPQNDTQNDTVGQHSAVERIGVSQRVAMLKVSAQKVGGRGVGCKQKQQTK
jgi:hypothetical protein